MLCSMKYLFMVFVAIGFASTILFINNSVTFDKLGAVNGLAVSMTAIARYFYTQGICLEGGGLGGGMNFSYMYVRLIYPPLNL